MIKLFADTTCSIPVDELTSMGIHVIPQIIVFGDESLRDDSQISHKEFIARLTSASQLPKTAAPPPVLYTDLFKQEAEAGNSMLIVCPSASLSGTVRSAETAKKDFPHADIRIVDTGAIGSGLGSLVRIAHRWIQDGKSLDEIVEKLTTLAGKNHSYFLVGTLEYLKRGGRIGGAKALLGSMLQLKPILTLVDGQAAPFENARTRQKGIARLSQLAVENCQNNPECYLTLMAGNTETEAETFAQELKSALKVEDVKVYHLPPAIMVHAGPDILAVSFFTS